MSWPLGDPPHIRGALTEWRPWPPTLTTAAQVHMCVRVLAYVNVY